MIRLNLVTSLLFIAWLTSCDSGSTNTTSQYRTEKKMVAIPAREAVDNDFNDFIEKFSADSSFQLIRTKYPLKVKWYEIEQDKDTLFYLKKSDFEMMDFREIKSNSQYDNWEQKRVIDKNNKSARIEIRGIDNGIIVDYLFEKVNGIWMLIEVDDSST
ncbi:MAG: DUF4348 domain-containing protein [Saprospiraceae bacterium]|nr:DUF4348 domain-containing protein [Saprospiraceae bacterium]